MKSCQKQLKHIECTLSFTEKMPFVVQICLTYSKFQSHKDHFTKLWIVICKSLSKYEIMQKYLQNIALALSYTPKMPFFGSNLPHLPNFWRLAYFLETGISQEPGFWQIWRLCQKNNNKTSFILGHFQPKLMSKFSEIWKKIFILDPFCPFSRQ